MKYLYAFAALVCLASCSPTPKQFVCFNPFLPIQSFEIDTSNPKVKEHPTSIDVEPQEGITVSIPKSLCVEVKRAESN